MENKRGKNNAYRPLRSGGSSGRDANTGAYRPVRKQAATNTQKEVPGKQTAAHTRVRKSGTNTSKQADLLSSPAFRYIALPLAVAALFMLLGLLISCATGL